MQTGNEPANGPALPVEPAWQGDLDWMRQDRPNPVRFGRVRRWLYDWAMKLARPALPEEEPLLPEKPYPDYVTCPHCGELEVEVWSDQKQGRCHNCGQVFDYPLPPAGSSGSGDGAPAEKPEDNPPGAKSTSDNY